MNFKELRDSMDQLLDKVSSSKTSKTITRDKYDAIIQHLTDPKIDVDPHFKAWVKKRKFALQNIPALDITNALIVPTEDGEDPEDGKTHKVALATFYLSYQLAE